MTRQKAICAGAILVILAAAAFQGGCTEQERAKSWGGTTQVDLPAGKKLVVATWKESNLWLLTRDMRALELAETYEFVEDSSWGVFEGKVVIRETARGAELDDGHGK